MSKKKLKTKKSKEDLLESSDEKKGQGKEKSTDVSASMEQSVGSTPGAKLDKPATPEVPRELNPTDPDAILDAQDDEVSFMCLNLDLEHASPLYILLICLPGIKLWCFFCVDREHVFVMHARVYFCAFRSLKRMSRSSRG